MIEINYDEKGNLLYSICGCVGNAKCGHLPPKSARESGRGCALNSTFITCPCCELKKQEGVR
jgi:hypothetical protein